MRDFVLILLMFFSTAGPAALIAFVGCSSIKAVARNPSATPKIFIVMIISFVFSVSIAMVALFIVFNLFSK